MASGKSTALRIFASECKAAHIPFKAITSSKVDASLSNRTTACDKNAIQFTPMEFLNESTLPDFGKYAVLIVDELQFFNKDSIKFLVDIVARGNKKTVKAAALQSDYEGNPIGDYQYFFSNANTINHYTSWCEVCCEYEAKDANYSLRLSDNRELLEVNTGKNYIPVCSEHFIQYKDSSKEEVKKILEEKRVLYEAMT